MRVFAWFLWFRGRCFALRPVNAGKTAHGLLIIVATNFNLRACPPSDKTKMRRFVSRKNQAQASITESRQDAIQTQSWRGRFSQPQDRVLN